MKKFLLYIFSVLLWGIWWTITIIITILSLLITLIIPKKLYDPLVVIISRILLHSALIFPRKKGINIKTLPFPVIFVINHVSIFDLFISAAILPGYPRGLEMKKFFSLPIYGWLITRFGNIPIEHENHGSLRKAFKIISNILKNRERNIVIMPEGKRTITGMVDNFKSGAFLLSRKNCVPIVPVVFRGLFEINNRTSIIIKPGFFDVIFLNPVYPENFKSDHAMMNHVRNLIIKKLENQK